MKNIVLKLTDIPKFWVLGIMAIYSLLLAEYYYMFMLKINVNIIDKLSSLTYLKFFINFNFFLLLFSSIVVWLISTFLFHLFSILLGGSAPYKSILKGSAFCYCIPAVCYIIAIIVLDKMAIPSNNVTEFFSTNKSFIFINQLINYSFIIYHILLLFLIKYIYQLNWIKALGTIIVPVGSIYLLGQFFAKFVL